MISIFKVSQKLCQKYILESRSISGLKFVLNSSTICDNFCRKLSRGSGPRPYSLRIKLTLLTLNAILTVQRYFLIQEKYSKNELQCENLVWLNIAFILIFKLHFKIVKTAYDDGYIMFHQIIQSTKECVNPLGTTVKIAGNLIHFNIFYIYILIYWVNF